jgi:type IV pilus assembly protein PilA
LLSSAQVPPVVITGYGEESALREMSRTRGVDASAIMVGAAIAIPNLLRARIAANEASAVSNIRTANTAQVMYASAYPSKGFARDLATLGSGPGTMSTHSATHAGFLEPTLGNATCTGSTWCQKSGFQFRLTAVCRTSKCAEYVVVATPISTATGTRSFCSTSDAVVRFKLGMPLTETIAASECHNWPPVQ